MGTIEYNKSKFLLSTYCVSGVVVTHLILKSNLCGRYNDTIPVLQKSTEMLTNFPKS